MKGIDKRLMHETGLAISIAENPLSTLILGLGRIASDPDLLEKYQLIQLDLSYT